MITTKEEQETHFLLNANNRETIHIFCDDPVWQRKLERAGAKVKRINSSGGKEYEILYKQLSIRKISQRTMTEEQKLAAKERMRKMREKRDDK